MTDCSTISFILHNHRILSIHRYNDSWLYPFLLLSNSTTIVQTLITSQLVFLSQSSFPLVHHTYHCHIYLPRAQLCSHILTPFENLQYFSTAYQVNTKLLSPTLLVLHDLAPALPSSLISHCSSVYSPHSNQSRLLSFFLTVLCLCH